MIGSGSGPYVLQAETNIADGYTQTGIQVQCSLNGGSFVLSNSFTFTEDIDLVKLVSPTIPNGNYNGESSSVAVTNTLTAFYAGSGALSANSVDSCELINAVTGVTIDTTYPFAVSAPTNNLSGATFNIQVQCKLKSSVVTDTTGFVQSNVAVFTQTCVPAPLPNVQIPNQNYHPSKVLDTIVPNVLFEFFDGTSRCISYVNWDKC